MRLFPRTLWIAGLALSFASLAAAQQAKTHQRAARPAPPESGVELAESGHCRSAIARLLRMTREKSDDELARRIGFDGLACARALNENVPTVDFLLFLNRRFPRDPQVLYVTTHAYSDLSIEASDELLAVAPHSVQAMLLEAESLEVQQRWKEATDEYRQILEKYPQTLGIHLRIARVELAESPTARTVADAKQQLIEELQQDPRDAAADDLLGSIAFRANDWNEAIERFSDATKLDAGLTDAYLGLGMALNSAGRFAEAIAPLKIVETRLPENATVHYQLLMAYMRLGRRQEAAREMTLFRDASAKAAQEAKRQIQGTPQSQPPR